jgi:hypothetical protein
MNPQTISYNQPPLSLNSIVKWTSGAFGTQKTKTGVIAQIVPAGELPDREQFRSLYTGAGVGSSRDQVSYVVAVKVGKTDKAKPYFYWPRANKLVAVSPTETPAAI